MSKNANTSALIIGFAMFAVFFGVGNLVFPPSDWAYVRNFLENCNYRLGHFSNFISYSYHYCG